MPGQIRTNKQGMRIAYNILKTPKNKQQDNQKKVPEEKVREWLRDSSTAQ